MFFFLSPKNASEMSIYARNKKMWINNDGRRIAAINSIDKAQTRARQKNRLRMHRCICGRIMNIKHTVGSPCAYSFVRSHSCHCRPLCWLNKIERNWNKCTLIDNEWFSPARKLLIKASTRHRHDTHTHTHIYMRAPRVQLNESLAVRDTNGHDRMNDSVSCIRNGILSIVSLLASSRTVVERSNQYKNTTLFIICWFITITMYVEMATNDGCLCVDDDDIVSALFLCLCLKSALCDDIVD